MSETEQLPTEHLRFPLDRPETNEIPQSIVRAAEILRGNGTVAFPTETVYGLGANALSETAVEKIFRAKERPGWDPLIVHVSEERMLGLVVRAVPARARLLIDCFWPGPLTLLLPRGTAIPDAVTAGRDRVGVRMPNHPVALALIACTGRPLAAPSANRFGRTSPTTAAHVLEDLDGRIDAVLDAGPTSVGVESTVLDVCDDRMVLYRPGGISRERIEAVVGSVELYVPREMGMHTGQGLPSPGVELRHYAPKAKLILVEGEGIEKQLHSQVEDWLLASEPGVPTAGVMLPQGWDISSSLRLRRFEWGEWNAPDVLARRLFAGLRHLDREGVSVIFCPVPPEEGIGAAIRDRLERASRSA